MLKEALINGFFCKTFRFLKKIGFWRMSAAQMGWGIRKISFSKNLRSKIKKCIYQSLLKETLKNGQMYNFSVFLQIAFFTSPHPSRDAACSKIQFVTKNLKQFYIL